MLNTFWSVASGQNFSEEQAFLKLFGNYDSTHKNAMWKNMKFPAKENADDFWQKRTGIVSSVLFQPYIENGKKKIFFLTKTIPIDIPFECHACLPLLSATVFSFDNKEWIVESQNPFLMYEGEYGELPAAKLVLIGKNKTGLLLGFENHGDEFTKEVAFLIPYKKSIVNAYQEIVYYENFSSCGWSIPCAAFTAKFNFIKSRKDDFYEIKVSKFGTKNDEANAYKTVPVDEELSYHFLNGKYVQISHV